MSAPRQKKATPKEKLLEHPGARWLLTRYPPAVPAFLVHISAPRKREDVGGTLWRRDISTSTWFPDLEDPATVGVLLAFVRKAYGSSSIDVVCEFAPEGEPWTWRVNLLEGDVRGPTEGAALVAALEAAP